MFKKNLNITTKPRAPFVQDARADHWVYRFLPNTSVPYAQLARWDRPIGWQLLLIPCVWSLALAFAARGVINQTSLIELLYYNVLFLIGAIAMRGAGCTLNDIVDVKIDKSVERTRSRPLASGLLTKRQAWLFLALQTFVGGCVLLQFNKLSIALGLTSVSLIIIYPFMKRITYWPQFFLGLAFSWGALLGWASMLNAMALPPLLLYIACICWTIGFDTIYACQDIEDDIKIGIGSTALRFKEHVALAVGVFYSLFVIFAATAFYLAQLSIIAYFGLFLTAWQLIWQIYKIDIANSAVCLRLFKSNAYTGVILYITLLLSAFV